MAQAEIGIMIEGQDGLNWENWRNLLRAAEDFGYQCLFRSDHFTNAQGEDKDSLELWASLTYAASHSQRIEFGCLVTPITFRHPSMTARYAAAVDDLSGGRMVLGVGAGWQAREHRKFGVPFYDFPTRYAMLEDGLEVISRLLRNDKPNTYAGTHFSLDDAILLPRPQRRMPILIGGNGPTRTLPLVVRYADEWNAVLIDLPTYRERAALLNDLLQEAGRRPDSVKRSLMTQVVFEETEAQLRERLAARNVSAQELRARGLIVGTAPEVVEQIGQWVEAGVERFMLQWLQQKNIAGLEAMARDVLPHFHR